MAKHHPCHLALIVITFFMFLVTVTFNALAGTSIGRDIGVYINDTGGRSDQFYLEITPAGWTFSIWGFIYAYQGIFLLYTLSTLCRKPVGVEEGYLYYAPNYLPAGFYLCYILNLCCNVSWLFVWDRAFLIPALVTIALIPFFLYIGIGISMYGVSKYGQLFVENGRYRELELIWGMVHNALGMYATWVTIATLLNFAMVLVYVVELDMQLCCSIALGILALELALWALMDFFFIERHTRFLFTPYFVVIVALTGSIEKNWNPAKRNSIITACLLGLAVCLLIVKIILVAWRQRVRPLFKHFQDQVKQPL